MTEACIPLQAGPLSLIYDNGMLRSVRCGEVEIVRRVYMALRDRFWNTVPYSIRDLSLRLDAVSFELSFKAFHQTPDIEFRWQGHFTGNAEGGVYLSMRGEAGTTFLRNRIGWCVLHPIGCCKGASCSVVHSDGLSERTFFPGDQIAPELPFADVCAMTYPVLPGVNCTLRCTGDIFETEDQRNWTDASYKTYSTPRALPLPVEVPSGTVIEQQVVLGVTGASGRRPVKSRSCRLVVNVEDLFRSAEATPGMGLGCLPEQLSDFRVVDRLRTAEPSHLRMDLEMPNGLDAAPLNAVISAARKTGCGVELAVHVTDEYTEELDLLVPVIGMFDRVPLRLLLYHAQVVVTPAEVVAAAVQRFGALHPHIGLFAGTNRYFVEVNRIHAPHRDIDGVCFSATPQVHTFDDRAVMENVEGLEACIKSAGMVYKSKKIVLSPLTMRPRIDPARPQKSGGADSRQQELFGAAWLVASIGACVAARLSGLTVFSAAAGPEGIMSANGDALFPVYQVLRSGIARAKAAAAVRLTGGESIVAAVAFVAGGFRQVLVANCTQDPDTVRLQGIPAGTKVAVLDNKTVAPARKDPDFWEHEQRPLNSSVHAEYTLQLPPYSVARMIVP